MYLNHYNSTPQKGHPLKLLKHLLTVANPLHSHRVYYCVCVVFNLSASQYTVEIEYKID